MQPMETERPEEPLDCAPDVYRSVGTLEEEALRRQSRLEAIRAMASSQRHAEPTASDRPLPR